MSKSKKILLVEDSRSVRQQVRSILSEAGYDVVEACDGGEGLKMIGEHSDIKMVLADINMPVKSGLEMLEEAADYISKGLQVVMLTTEGRPDYIKRAKAAGAKGWIVKPFSPAQLVSTVNKITENSNQPSTAS